MALFPGWTAPDFAAETTAGQIRFHAWLDNGWGVVVTHPGDYSLQSLLGAVAWARSCARPIKLLGLSSAGRHAEDGMALPAAAVVADIPDFPIIQDDTGRIASLWRGVTTDVASTGAPFDDHVVFIVDSARTIRTTISYPPSRDRNFVEIIEVVEAFDTGCHSARHTRRAA
jgi:thioredoxin-dependent peroxiredoxin